MTKRCSHCHRLTETRVTIFNPPKGRQVKWSATHLCPLCYALRKTEVKP